MGTLKDIAEQGAALVVAVLSASTSGAGPVVIPAAALGAMAYQRYAKTSGRVIERAQSEIGKALADCPDIAPESLATANALLRQTNVLPITPRLVAESLCSENPGLHLARQLFGNALDEDPSLPLILSTILAPAIDILRRDNRLVEVSQELQIVTLHEMKKNQSDVRSDITRLHELLSNLSGGGRDELLTLAGAFGIEDAPARNDAELRKLLQHKAEDYRSLSRQIEALDERTVALGSLKAEARKAVSQLDFAKVEVILGQIDEIETGMLVETKELRADNALLIGDENAAFRHFSAAADAIAQGDTLSALNHRRIYAEKLIGHARRFGGNGFQLGASMLEKAIQFLTKDSDPELYAEVQARLANMQSHAGYQTGGPQGLLLLDDAKSRLGSLVPDFADTDPLMWGMLQRDLADSLSMRGQLAGADGIHFLTEAIRAYEAASAVFTVDLHAVTWASCQGHLAIALEHLAMRTNDRAAENYLTASISAAQAAARIWKNHHHRDNWAGTQTSIGNASRRLSENARGGAKGVLLQQARTAYLAALEVYQPDTHPKAWANTLDHLSMTLHATAKVAEMKDKAGLLEEAANFSTSALDILTLERHPFDWAIAQTSLANVLGDQSQLVPPLARRDLLLKAKAAYEASQAVFTPDSHPLHAALTAESLARVHVNLSETSPAERDGHLWTAFGQANSACRLAGPDHSSHRQRMERLRGDIGRKLGAAR